MGDQLDSEITVFCPNSTTTEQQKPAAELEKLEIDMADFNTTEHVPIEEMDVEGVGEEEERGKWSHKMDFILSLLGYAVGLSNIWRFPYLCYRNGGGAFLIPYWIFMFTSGVPLFFMETAIGQFTSKSALGIWSIAPILKGAGMATIIISMVCSIYYNTLMAYIVFYFVQSFTLGSLPWSSCDNEWNTPDCLNYNNDTLLGMYQEYREYAKDPLNTSLPGFAYEETFNRTLRSPSDEYFHNRVLQISDGLDSPGGICWELFFCLIPVWFITGICLIKGIKSVGKVVYFTATFPYLVLVVLLIRGLSLPGAMDGIRFYIIPDFAKLGEFQVWCDAAFQVFFSMGPGWGGLIMMGSYNKLDNDCYRDGIIVPILMGLTSLFAGFVVFSTVGFMAHSIGRPVGEVVSQGPGLAFIMYPEVVTKLPFLSQFWSAIFFVMLFTLGLDSTFVMLEMGITTIWDELPPRYRVKREWILLVVTIFCFIGGIPFMTRAGMYLFQVVDTYSGTFTAIAVCTSEAVAVFWIYGAERFLDDINFMIGYRPHVFVWTIIWRICTTGVLLGVLLVAIVQYAPLTHYGDYKYPEWSKTLGWSIGLMSLLWIPGWAIGRIALDSGSTLLEKLKGALRPTRNFGPANMKHRKLWNEYRQIKPYGKNLFYRFRHINTYRSVDRFEEVFSDC